MKVKCGKVTGHLIAYIKLTSSYSVPLSSKLRIWQLGRYSNSFNWKNIFPSKIKQN